MTAVVLKLFQDLNALSVPNPVRHDLSDYFFLKKILIGTPLKL